jgi:hypothetical protein
VPWNDESDAAAGVREVVLSAGFMVELSLAAGLCANATVASSADPSRPAVKDFANI